MNFVRKFVRKFVLAIKLLELILVQEDHLCVLYVESLTMLLFLSL